MARTIKMLSDMDTTMMEVERVDRAGDRLLITGVMMGNFPAEIYLEPDDLLAMVVMHLRVSPLTFVLGLPYFRLRCHWRRSENNGAGARLRSLLTSLLLGLGGLFGIAALVLGTAQIVHLLARLL